MLPRIDLGTFAAMFDGIVTVLNENGYNILLANTRDQLEEEVRYLNLFHEKRVDGVLYFATGINLQHVEAISKFHKPVVIVGQSRHASGLSVCPSGQFRGGQSDGELPHLPRASPDWLSFRR